MRHRRRKGEELPDRKQEPNTSHKQARARVEHVFARMKTCKILHDCRLKGDGVHHAMLASPACTTHSRRTDRPSGYTVAKHVRATRRSFTGQPLSPGADRRPGLLVPACAVISTAIERLRTDKDPTQRRLNTNGTSPAHQLERLERLNQAVNRSATRQTSQLPMHQQPLRAPSGPVRPSGTAKSATLGAHGKLSRTAHIGSCVG